MNSLLKKIVIGSVVICLLSYGGVQIHEIQKNIRNLENRQTRFGQDINELITKLNEPSEIVGAVVQPFAGQTYTLFGGGLSSTATSIILSSLTIKQTSQKIVDADLSDTFYITLEPGSNSKQEIVSCTTVTQNGNGTATLSGCSRGLSPIPNYAASTTLQFAHGGNTSVIFSDPPQLFNQFAARLNDELITGNWTFTSTNTPAYNFNPVWSGEASTTFASKGYADDLSFAGVADASFTGKGIVEAATALEAASSSPVGSGNTAAYLALTSSISSSTPFNGTNSIGPYIVSLQTNGKIHPFYISTTSSSIYEWGGSMMFNATTTSTATSTFAGASFRASTSSPFVWGGIPFAFNPNTGQASSSVLTIDGNGTFSFQRPSWSLLKEVILDTGTATITVSSIPAASDLRVVIDGVKSAAEAGTTIIFNNDSANNYAFRWNINDVAARTVGAVGGIGLVIEAPAVTVQVNQSMVFDITNSSTTVKTVQSMASTNDGVLANVVDKWVVNGWWNSTALINRIDIGAGASGLTWNAKTRVSIYGSNSY